MVVATDSAVDTREAILDACDRLMARYGFRKTTMEDLAQEAGLSRRTIYAYFRNKEDVGLSSISRVVGQVYGEMEEFVLGDRRVSDRLHDVLMVRVLGRLKRVQGYSHSLNELFEMIRPAYMELREGFYEREQALIGGLIAEGRESGEFGDVDPTKTAECMILATNAFVPYSLSPVELGSIDDIQKRLETMVGLLMASITNPLHRTQQ